MAFVPDRAGFLDLARQGRLAFVYREVLADTDTPVSAFAKLGRGPVLVPARERGRRRQVGGLQLRGRAAARGGARARHRGRDPEARRRRKLSRRRARHGRRAAALPGRLPGEADAGGAARAAALLRRRGRLAGLRHRAQLRAAPEHEARRPGSARALLRHHRHRRRVRQPARHRQGRGVGRRRRRARSGPRLRRRLPAHRGGAGQAGAAGAAAAPAGSRAGGGGRRAERDRDARGVRGGRAPHPGVHPGGRRVPGRLLAALPGAARRRRPVRRLPRPARHQPVAVHVSPRVSRGGGHRRVTRGAGAAGRRRDRGAPDRRHAPARRAPPRRTRRWRPSCAAIRRSWPSTRC